MFGNVRLRHKSAVIDSKPQRKRKLSFWGAHASGVLTIPFCDRELLLALIRCLRVLSKEKSSSKKNAATSTLQACAPRSALD
jgi:hypothetical protein